MTDNRWAGFSQEELDELNNGLDWAASEGGVLCGPLALSLQREIEAEAATRFPTEGGQK